MNLKNMYGKTDFLMICNQRIYFDTDCNNTETLTAVAFSDLDEYLWTSPTAGNKQNIFDNCIIMMTRNGIVHVAVH